MFRSRSMGVVPCEIVEGPRLLWKPADWLVRVQLEMVRVRFKNHRGKTHTVWVKTSRIIDGAILQREGTPQ